MSWRWLSLVVGALLVVAMVSIAAASVALYGPFDPGDGSLYRGQRGLEELLVRLAASPQAAARQRIRLAERRLQAVQRLAGSQHESAALAELEQALRTVVQAASICPAADNSELRLRALDLFLASGQLFRYLARPASNQQPDTMSLQTWIASITQQLRQPGFNFCNFAGLLDPSAAPEAPAAETSALPSATPLWVNPHIVYFPPGSLGAQHQFYPLVGSHAEIDCLGCHMKGEYAGIQNQCEGCHQAHMPADHYPGMCALCHSPTGWMDIVYEHPYPEADDCTVCHQKVRPVEHYPGQCSACHTTTAWTPAWFDHAAAQATDCQTCHAINRPVGHWNGQCSLCHSTTAWVPASFNHAAAGATDCQSCHTRPAGHWGGQCSACHSTSAWRPASFNHAAAGATDCIACHSSRRPANHFDGQCSGCHSTNAWTPANFNHSFPMNHGGAGGKCATCHPSGGSSWTCFNCHNKAEMDKKHNEKGIPDYASRCLECHAGGNNGGDD
jgi:hypothetical protein